MRTSNVKQRAPFEILVAESDENTLNALSRFLQWEGHVVFEARSFAEAKSVLQLFRVEVLLVSLALLEGEGGGSLERLPPTKACTVALGISAESVEREQKLARGFAHYLPKPWALRQVGEILEDHAARLRSTPLERQSAIEQI